MKHGRDPQYEKIVKMIEEHLGVSTETAGATPPASATATLERVQLRGGLKRGKAKEDDADGGFASIIIGAVVVAAIGAVLYAFRRPLLRGIREKRSDKLPSAFDTIRRT
jgi:hypothetical protein